MYLIKSQQLSESCVLDLLQQAELVGKCYILLQLHTWKSQPDYITPKVQMQETLPLF